MKGGTGRDLSVHDLSVHDLKKQLNLARKYFYCIFDECLVEWSDGRVVRQRSATPPPLRSCGRVVRQRSAKPFTPVQFRARPHRKRGNSSALALKIKGNFIFIMFLITTYLVALFLSPFKGNIQDLDQKILNSWLAQKAKYLVVSKEVVEQPVNQVQIPINSESLDKLSEVPRAQDGGKNQKNNLVVWAKKAVLIDADTGRVLYDEKMLEDHHIASITKTMTTLVLMDQIKDWNDKVKISSYAASAGGATVNFLSGEKFKAIDLLKAMLMNSDNTAARALAEYVSDGHEEKFAELMNAKAKELHLKNSYFTDASGLDDENSHSCAYDVAQIARKILEYPMVLEIMQTPSHIQIVGDDEFQRVHQVGNTDELLGKYSGIIGAKTGFTYNAGYCLMMMREGSNGKKVIGVVLDAGETQRWTEMQKMLDWVFKEYHWSVFPASNKDK